MILINERCLVQVESSQVVIRILGLSATLPNYIDVARFLCVNPQTGLFFFDGRFRPVPLAMTFIGRFYCDAILFVSVKVIYLFCLFSILFIFFYLFKTSWGPNPDISGFETSGHTDHQMSSPVARTAVIVRLADSFITS